MTPIDPGRAPGRGAGLVVALALAAAGCEHGNQPPAFATTPPATATEDVRYAYAAAVDDPDGPGATWSLARGHTCGGELDATGTFTFTPAGPVAPASCVLALQVCDGSASNWCAVQTATIHIEAVDDAPFIDSLAPAQAFEGQPYEYRATVVDLDGPAAQWSLAAAHTCGGAIDPARGVFTFTPGDAPPPTCDVAVRVCAGATPVLCDEQARSVTIVGQNDPPTIVSVAPTMVAEGAVYAYHAAVADPDGPEQAWNLGPGHSCGGAIASDGLYTFAALGPAPPATCRVSLVVCDGGAPSGCAGQQATVTVALVDDPPIATDDAVLMFDPAVAPSIAILANDPDLDGGPRAIAAVTQPGHGTATLVGERVVYRPAAGYCNAASGALDTFTYTLAPGGAVATVSVWVACVGATAPGATLSSGDQHTCEVRADGTAWCWGANAEGQLGDGTTTARALPRQVGTATDWSLIELGAIHTCGLRTDGSLWCWGQNDGTQLGDGTAIDRPSPLQVPGAWSTVAAGDTHTCGTRADRTLWCWGWNGRGQLGDGTTTYRPLPGQVGTLATWLGVSLGNSHSCALAATTGRLSCWGDNLRQQIAATLELYRTPVAITTSAWASVSAGRHHTCAIQLDGTLWCWGGNGDRQLGDGTAIDRAAPRAVGTLAVWATVSAGAGHTCATQRDGSLWCWGRNAEGQLGDGTTTERAAPTRIGPPTGWVAVAAGGDHTCARRADGSTWCWGKNDQGQLGDGTFTSRPTPAPIGAP